MGGGRLIRVRLYYIKVNKPHQFEIDPHLGIMIIMLVHSYDVFISRNKNIYLSDLKSLCQSVDHI